MTARRREKLDLASGILTIAAFCALLVAPLASKMLGLAPAVELDENRVIAPLPRLERGNLREFPKLFSDYYTDNFGFRNFLVDLHHRILLRAFNSPPGDGVLAGPDDWLFMKASATRTNSPFSSDEIDSIISRLESYRDWIEHQGSRFLFIVVPDKLSIYPENLPRSVTYDESTSRLSRFMRRLEERGSSLNVLDLRSALKGQKAAGLLYFKTGSHWSDDGELVAFDALRQNLSEDFPTFAESPSPELTQSSVQSERNMSRVFVYPGAFSEEINIYSLVSSQTEVLETKGECCPHGRMISTRIQSEELPEVVLVHDSFFSHFRLISRLFREYARSFWSLQYRQDGKMAPILAQAGQRILASKPDLVVFEIVERNLHMIGNWRGLAPVLRPEIGGDVETENFNRGSQANADPFDNGLLLRTNGPGEPPPRVTYRDVSLHGAEKLGSEIRVSRTGPGAMLVVRASVGNQTVFEHSVALESSRNSTFLIDVEFPEEPVDLSFELRRPAGVSDKQRTSVRLVKLNAQ